MPGDWIRRAKTAPIGGLYGEPLGAREAAFIYFGWAGIILRTKDHAIAFDLCQKNFRRAEAKALEHLDLQCYTHTHWDHWYPPHAKAILARTGAPILVEPAILEDLGTLSSNAVTAVRPGEPIAIGDLTVRGVVGIHPRPITMFHVETPELRVFHGGDSDHVPLGEYPADLAFVPVGAPSPSCSPESALAMVRDVGAKVAVAVHGAIEESEAFRELVAAELPETQVVIPGPCELVTLTVPS